MPTGMEWCTLPKKNLWKRIGFGRRSPLAEEVVRRSLSLVWHVSGGGFPEPLECPYLATVWDVQHRTHPFLPEMQEKGEWFHRESKTFRFLAQAAGIITGTEVGARELEKAYGIFPEKIMRFPHPTPTFFQPAVWRLNHPSSPPYFLYPANFWPHKNHATLVRALALLTESHQEARLIFTGQGKNLPFIQELGRNLGVDKRLEFLGHVTDTRLRDLYDGATALVYASLSGPENLPPLEAMARGCPVLNSDFPGAREQLGEAAIFIFPTSAEAWAAEMSRLLQPTAVPLRKKLAEEGCKKIQEKTVQNYVDRVQDWIQSFRSIRSLWP